MILADVAVPQATVWTLLGGFVMFGVTLIVTRALNAQQKRHEDHDRRHEEDATALVVAKEKLESEAKVTRHDLANRLTGMELRLSLVEQRMKHHEEDAP